MARERVLIYCGEVARAEGGEDWKEGPVRGIGATDAGEGSPQAHPEGAVRVGKVWKVVDERLDPYSARDYTEETRGERLARQVREERAVEDITRARSWGVVSDRCGGRERWEDTFRRWEENERRGR